MRKLLLAVAALFAFWPTAVVHAQAWPSKPIRFVLSFGPGSASDAISRILAQELTATLGQPVVIIHKPGADGSISGIEVQRSAPDGYTFLFGTNSALAVAPNLRKTPPYNVLTDFTPVSLVGINTLFFVVNPTLPAKSIAELVAYCRANPGKLDVATGNTYAIVATGLFAKNNGLKVETIPYKSEPDAIVDLLAGRVQLIISTSTPVIGHVKEGKLRALATTTDERSPLFPDVPSHTETGQEKFPFAPWFAVVGPAGLPAEIVTALNKAIVAAIAKPAVREQMQKHGVVPKSTTPDEIVAYIKDQHDIWKSSLRDANIEQQ